MQKRTIDPLEYAGAIAQANPKGILFTTKAGGEVDTMVIGWGLIGNIWGKPTFTAFIRTSRHSHKLVEESGEFTINVPEERMDSRIFKVAGSQTGRHVDKVTELGLTLIEPQVVNTPAIAECPITLECKVMYKQLLDADAIPAEFIDAFYPPEIDDPDATGRNCYMHVAYYGEIVSSYILEQDEN